QPKASPFQFYEIDHDPYDHHRHAGGVDGIRTGPYFFVDRKYHVPCISDEKKQGSADKKSIDHLRSFPFLDDVISAEITKQHLRHRTKKAHQSFRIKGDRLSVYS